MIAAIDGNVKCARRCLGSKSQPSMLAPDLAAIARSSMGMRQLRCGVLQELWCVGATGRPLLS
jgi:hypothetical protein